MSGSEAPPVLVEVLRGGLVESGHRGAFAVVDAAGRVVRSAGPVDRPVYPRSAIKPVQALPLVETGAADKYGLGDAELALACASHRGEPHQVERVAAWLARLGLGPEDLECGAHPPTDPAASLTLARFGTAPTALHNNCSGKHAGFLTTALALGEPTQGYIRADHPVQRRVLAALESMTGLDLGPAPRGIDGCGIPVIGVPLIGLARAMARLGDPAGLPEERRAAAGRILAAMRAEPAMVEGKGGMTTTVLEVAGAAVCLKPGAEGVFCAVLPGEGLGVALKIADGAKRAAELAMATLLDRLGCFGAAARTALGPFLAPRLQNAAGVDVGCLRAAGPLADEAIL